MPSRHLARIQYSSSIDSISPLVAPSCMLAWGPLGSLRIGFVGPMMISKTHRNFKTQGKHWFLLPRFQIKHCNTSWSFYHSMSFSLRSVQVLQHLRKIIGSVCTTTTTTVIETCQQHYVQEHLMPDPDQQCSEKYLSHLLMGEYWYTEYWLYCN